MNCIHGIEESWCSFCKSRKEQALEKREPKPRGTTTIYGQGVVQNSEIMSSGYALVSIKGKKSRCNFSQINRSTTFVHIDGWPFLWAIKHILELAPNLKKIRVIPRAEKKIHESHRQVCAERGIRIVTGHHRPQSIWRENHIISRHYKSQRRFFLNLKGEQQALFEELLRLGFEQAQIASRYFCLHEEEFIHQSSIAEEFGYGKEERHISIRINAVICYLDSSFEGGDRPKQMALAIQRKVLRIRNLISEEAGLLKIAAKLGFERLSESLPLSRIPMLETLIEAKNDGRLAKLQLENPRAYLVISKRYGLEDNVFRILKDITEFLGVTTVERVRQIEAEALGLLGIIDEDND